jgi:glucose/arabinose dehydrogenase
LQESHEEANVILPRARPSCTEAQIRAKMGTKKPMKMPLYQKESSIMAAKRLTLFLSGKPRLVLGVAGCLVLAACGTARPPAAVSAPTQAAKIAEEASSDSPVLTGQDALSGDWSTDGPGVKRLIKVQDLPPPYATPSVDNGPGMVPRPDGALPKAPAGFNVEEYASGFDNPRNIITAPNGDIFVVESEPGRIKVLRDTKNAGKPDVTEVYAEGLKQPFGMAFYPLGPNPRYLYVANTDSVLRFPYQNGDLKARGASTVIVPDIPGGGRLRGGGHWTRDIIFSPDGKKMFVSVGSHSNNSDDAQEVRRADILQFNPDGTGERIYASGIRNAVGITINPKTGQLWASVNERDTLGDNLVPDYITHVQEGGFYGWPWYYLGSHQDPYHKGAHPELAGHILVPDVLLQSHSASLKMAFYEGAQFPNSYKDGAFAAEHGSWNRARRTGYKVIFVPMQNGQATGVYEDFLTGFVTSDGKVWGRPVGVTVAKDGSLLVSDDGSNTLWRVHYTGEKTAKK